MRLSEKISLLLLTVLGAFSLAAEEFSKESMDFLSARPAGAQEETFELTAAGADAIRLLSRFDSKRLGPTASRLEMLTHSLARLAT